MIFCIITHVHHSKSKGNYFGYAPYVNEMNIWLKYADKVIIVAPLKNVQKSAIHKEYEHPNIVFMAVPDFSLTSGRAVIKTIFNLPVVLFSIFKGMSRSTHIHLRCPGNMGFLGSVVQLLFPNKSKSAKYAGNWDANSKQPFTYRLQKSILSNTLLTRKLKVLVYGEWPNQSKNVQAFFTATYWESEKVPVPAKSLNNTIQFLFVGTLTRGKQPLYAVKLVEELKKRGHKATLSLYGEGSERQNLENYIQESHLSDYIHLKGNLTREEVKIQYQQSHFIILPSKSEGWPKVIAEAMFWGCIPIATKVSCVPAMLDFGNRGLLLSEHLEPDVDELERLCRDQAAYNSKNDAAVAWSRSYTLDAFESKIKRILR